MGLISKCRSCGSSKLSNILSLGDQYLSDFRVDDLKPDKYPLHLLLCRECSLFQLGHTVPSSKLYNDHYGYYSGINNTIKADLKDIVEKAQKMVDLKEGDVWLDIGANDGTLLSFVPDTLVKVACDPIKKFAVLLKKITKYVISDFWNYETYEKLKDS